MVRQVSAATRVEAGVVVQGQHGDDGASTRSCSNAPLLFVGDDFGQTDVAVAPD